MASILDKNFQTKLGSIVIEKQIQVLMKAGHTSYNDISEIMEIPESSIRFHIERMKKIGMI